MMVGGFPRINLAEDTDGELTVAKPMARRRRRIWLIEELLDGEPYNGM